MSSHDVLIHAISLEQQHSITTRREHITSTSTSTSTSTPIQFHQPLRLTAICEDEEDDDDEYEHQHDDEQTQQEVELDDVVIDTKIPSSIDTSMDEPLLTKPTSTTTSTPTWTISRIFTISSLPLPTLSLTSWSFLTTLMLAQTYFTIYSYIAQQTIYSLYIPLHILPSIIILRWWLDTVSTPDSPILKTTIATKLSPYDTLIRTYAFGFFLVSAAVMTFESTLGHLLLNSFINYIPTEQHHYYFIWVGCVSGIFAMGEEVMKYFVASRVLSVNIKSGNKLPILFLTSGTLGCITACSLFFTLFDTYTSTSVSQLLSFHYSLIAMIPGHVCTATFIGLCIAHRRLIPESYICTSHILLIPILLRLSIITMYFSYIMLFTTMTQNIFMMMLQMTVIVAVVVQLPYMVYQKYCAIQLTHIY